MYVVIDKDVTKAIFLLLNLLILFAKWHLKYYI